MTGQKGEVAEAPTSRRERGVIAQREYRKRHANKVHTLQEENTVLKKAIADIDSALRGKGSLADELSSILASARKAAGLPEPSEPSEPENNVPQQSKTLPQAEAQAHDADADPLNLLTQARLENMSLSPAPQLGHYSALSAASGRLSPRLDHGLWNDADRPVRLFDPPEDIAPYIGHAANTIAGAIFWSCMSRISALWKDHNQARAAKVASGDPSTVASPATVSLRRIFSLQGMMRDKSFLVSLAQSRLDYKQKGYMFGRLQDQFHSSSSPALADMHRQAESLAAAQGMPPSMWKTPQDVAAMIKSQITGDEAARMDAVAQGRGTDGDAYLLSIIVVHLANAFVCFGDGPRWNTVYLSMAVGSWLKVLQDPAEPKTWERRAPSECSLGPEPEMGQEDEEDVAPVSPSSPADAADRAGGTTST
ncbi:hypothetical protein ACHAQH_008334 [Verticillium albo-atrum]